MKIPGLLLTALMISAAAASRAAPAPEGAEVYFISPTDGEIIEGPVTVRFGLRGMGVSPAGLDSPGTGHHHLLIDTVDLPPLDRPLPKTEHIVHFGGGQTETVLNLPPGPHTLRLLLGDFTHTPHDTPVISDAISITVKEH